MNTIWQPTLEGRDGPKYRAVVDAIREATADGTLPVGQKLPPVRDLAWQLSITPGTVARAYTILTDEGVLESHVGRGTFVAAPKSQMQEDIWSRSLRRLEATDPGHVSLFAPRLADMGQVTLIREAMKHAAEAEPALFLNYPTRDYYQPVREAVRDWLSDLPLGPFGEEDVVLTHGGQNGICVILQAALTGSRPVLLVEELSYAGFRRAAELMRAEVVAVRMDEQGMDPEDLDRLARIHGAQMVCLTPEVQNPTGGHMPLARRKALLAVAERHDMQVLEDDCYRMGAAREPSLRALAPDRCWHVSSISKSLTPALRVGFALAPLGRTAELRKAAEYGYFGLSQPLAETTRLLLTHPRIHEVVARVQARMADYVRVAVNVLGGYDLRWDPEVPFLWLTLPAGWRAAGFCRAAERDGVQIRSADEFSLRDGRAPHAVRIAINGNLSLEVFESAMERLRALLSDPPEQISV